MSTIAIDALDEFGYDAPVTELESPHQFEPIGDLGASRYRHTFPVNRHLDALLINKGENTLVVSFHGALNRSKYNLPRFERLKPLRRRNVNSLYFSDPTLWMDDKLQLGWYTGWKGEDIQQQIAQWIIRAAMATNSKKIIVTGSSGGGFAALQVSALIPNSVCLPFNPSTTIHGYLINGEPGKHGTEREYVRVVYPEEAPNGIWHIDFDIDWTVGKGDQLSVLKRYSKQTKNWVLFAQTPTDWHYDQHYLPFLAAAAKGDNLARIRVLEYGNRVGHFPPSPQEFSDGLDAALEWAKNLPDNFQPNSTKFL